ncbi:hypothetical protein K7432_006513 [Basidiobolus ranarum]|uniref:Uncharacterized protein n=1 Tax=Basidiobolus ranarum TaxID=34480 RepID=A0ABR2WUT1_9FUNG
MVNGNQVASLFETLMDNMGIEENKRDPLRTLPEEQKRAMIRNQTRRETRSPATFLVKRYHKFNKKFPEYYIRKLSEANVKALSANDYKSLHVSLSTQAISWVRQFVELKGLQFLTESIYNSCNKLNRNMTDLSLEYEIMKCIKSVLNTKIGAKSVLAHPKCITEITFALESPSLGVRKLTVDILAFICYLNIPTGRQYVVDAMKHIQQIRQYDYIYEVWLRHFTLDIWRSGNDTEVDCNKYDKISSDTHFYEYLESNFIFMNSLIDTCGELKSRITTRLHMIASGIRSVVHKAKRFGSSTVNYQLKRYVSREEADYMSMCSADFSWRGINPHDLFMATFRPVDRTKSHKPFLSILNHLLHAQRNPKSRNNYYQLLDSVVEQMVSEEITTVHKKVSRIFEVQELSSASEDESIFSSRISRLRGNSIARSSSSILSDQYPKTPTIDSFSMCDSLVNGTYAIRNQFGDSNKEGIPPPPPPVPPGVDEYTKRTPQKPVKKFNWEKLPEYAVENTFWKEGEIVPGMVKLEEELEKDGIFEELEDRFAVKNNHTTPTFEVKKQAPKYIQLLDRKRSHQIDIMLSSMKQLSPSEVCEAFLKSDISEDLLENFMKCLPTEQEAKVLESYLDYEGKELGRAEAVLIETLKIDSFEEKLKAVYLKITFNEKAFGMEKSLDSILQACETLKSSEHLAKLLQLILIIGNFMNGKDFRGNAKGFKIHSLNRLNDIRTNNDSTTLLHFLLNVIEKKFPELLKIREELKITKVASQGSFTEISDMIYTLRNEHNKLARNLGVAISKEEMVVEAEVEDSSLFFTEMRRFFSEAKNSLATLEEKLNNTREVFDETVRFYGEDADTISCQDFFEIFRDFSYSLNNTFKDNQVEKEKREILEKRRERQQQIELRKEQQQSLSRHSVYDIDVSSITDEDSDNKGVMDNLLESLRDHRKLSKRREKKRPEIPKLHTEIYRDRDMGAISATPSPIDIDPLSARATELLNQIQYENKLQTSEC